MTTSRLAPLLLAVPCLAAPPSHASEATTEASAWFAAGPQEELEEVEVVRVETGDTLRIRRDGVLDRVRLRSVDAEEPRGTRDALHGTKPHTPFGNETVVWLKAFLDEVCGERQRRTVRLRFLPDEPRRDFYDRLLAHVVLPDDRDLNLLLVRKGFSPYYNKYGNSVILHDAFVAAQAAARREKLGIWNPTTNAPTGDDEVERRPYTELCAWWDARAAAIDDYRARRSADPAHVLHAEDPEQLDRAAQSGVPVEVFGEIQRIAKSEDGARRVTLRSPHREQLVVVRVSADVWTAMSDLTLDRRIATFSQNYLWIAGKLEPTDSGFDLRTAGAEAWRLAGPEPSIGD